MPMGVSQSKRKHQERRSSSSSIQRYAAKGRGSMSKLQTAQSIARPDTIMTTTADATQQATPAGKKGQSILKKQSKREKRKGSKKRKKKAQLKTEPESVWKNESQIPAQVHPAELTAKILDRGLSPSDSRSSQTPPARKPQTDFLAPSSPAPKSHRGHRKKKSQRRGSSRAQPAALPSSISLSPPQSVSIENPYSVKVFGARFAAAKKDFMMRQQKGLPPKEFLKGIDTGNNYWAGVPNNEALRVAERRHFERGLAKSRFDDEQDTEYETIVDG